MSKHTSKEWLRKRKWTCINICIGTFIFGLCQSVYFQTEYLYFKNTMKVKKPELFYGLGEVIESIGGLISSLLPVYYADKSKNVRQILFIIVSAMLLGNIFYTLYYSPYFVLFGHLLIGCCSAVEVIGYGEAVRIYNPKELTKITSFLTIFTALGHAAGPCLTFLFSLVDVRIAGWKIVAGNMPGITMAVFILFYLVLMFFTLNNVSKDFTLKDADESTSLLETVDKTSTNYNETDHLVTGVIRKTDKNGIIEQNNTFDEDIASNIAFVELEMSFKKGYALSINLVRKNVYLLMLLVICVLLTIPDEIIYLLQPINAVEYLHWNQIDLARLNLVIFTASTIPTSLLCMYLSEKVNDCFILLVGIVTLIMSQICMLMIPIVNTMFLKAGTYSISVFVYGIYAVAFHVSTRSMIAKYVPENIQTITEAFRMSLTTISYLIGGLLISIIVEYLIISLAIFCILSFICLCWVCINMNAYSNIKVIALNL